MKDAAEKVSIIYTISPTHFHPEIGSMVGIWSMFFEELLLTF
jgi:hypothetical protein